MKKINEEIISQILDFAIQHPETPYHQIAVTFDVSEVSIKRYCSSLGRSKNWRRGRASRCADPERFLSKVNRRQANECWLWIGCVNDDGYGFLHWNGQNIAAHRLAFELVKGKIPEGLDVDHECRTRRCCNPNHLTPVTHRQNMERAGIIPPMKPLSIDTPALNIETATGIDTALPELPTSDQGVASYHLKDTNIKPNIETRHSPAAVSMEQSQSQPTLASGKQPGVPIITARPRKADPFAPIRVMEAAPEIEIPEHPARKEGPSGTKADLGIDDWAQTEFGPFWVNQTDEQLRIQTVFQRTEVMRERGEYLHWYFVMPTNPSHNRTGMSARTGPEACVKVERNFGKGWAASWEYARPDPHRGPYFEYRVVLTTGAVTMTVARTVADAIAMVEEVWGRPGDILECSRLSRPTPGHLQAWSLHWREFLTEARSRLEQHGQGGVCPAFSLQPPTFLATGNDSSQKERRG